MFIAGHDLPSIGFIRAKPHPCGRLYTLSIYPPATGALAGSEPATMIELDTGVAEVRRIAEVAPHLIATPRGGWNWP